MNLKRSSNKNTICKQKEDKTKRQTYQTTKKKDEWRKKEQRSEKTEKITNKGHKKQNTKSTEYIFLRMGKNKKSADPLVGSGRVGLNGFSMAFPACLFSCSCLHCLIATQSPLLTSPGRPKILPPRGWTGLSHSGVMSK